MNLHKLNAYELKHKSSGNWLNILSFYGMEDCTGIHTPCPICGGTDRYRFDDKGSANRTWFCSDPEQIHGSASKNGIAGDGFDLLMHGKGINFYGALKLVQDYFGHSPASHPPAQRIYRYSPKKVDQHQRSKTISAILRKAQKRPHAAALSYYQRRGIQAITNYPLQSLYYHNALPYYVQGKALLKPDKTWYTWSCILGVFSNSKGWSGLYRIYLNKEGRKATRSIQQAALENGIDTQKIKLSSKNFLMLKGCFEGDAIRLNNTGNTLHVAEGMETGLAVVLHAKNNNVAITGQRANMASLEIPTRIKHLVIWADKDRNQSGEQAAKALRDRYQNQCNVIIKLPLINIPKNKRSIDWLDVKNNKKS